MKEIRLKSDELYNLENYDKLGIYRNTDENNVVFIVVSVGPNRCWGFSELEFEGVKTAFLSEFGSEIINGEIEHIPERQESSNVITDEFVLKLVETIMGK